jgi:3-hydroxybutyryl-CoA dehydratase
MKKGDLFSYKFLVSEETYQGFIHLFKDRNPLHTDAAFAVQKGFQAEVMHGNILNGFISWFVGEGLPDKNVIIQSQEIKYALPVYKNDELILQAEITDIFESVNMVEFKYYFQNSSGKKVAKGKIQIGII